MKNLSPTTYAGIYINCRRYPFVTWILDGWKPYETRTERALHPLIGQRVFLIETGRGKSMIIGSATIASAQLVFYSDVLKRQQAQILGTDYDILPKSYKWFYRMKDTEWLPKPIPAPETRKNHGRSYCTWEA